MGDVESGAQRVGIIVGLWQGFEAGGRHMAGLARRALHVR